MPLPVTPLLSLFTAGKYLFPRKSLMTTSNSAAIWNLYYLWGGCLKHSYSKCMYHKWTYFVIINWLFKKTKIWEHHRMKLWTVHFWACQSRNRRQSRTEDPAAIVLSVSTYILHFNLFLFFSLKKRVCQKSDTFSIHFRFELHSLFVSEIRIRWHRFEVRYR